jgi:type IV secretory pathway TraG/TraD family ATPase VirD4
MQEFSAYLRRSMFISVVLYFFMLTLYYFEIALYVLELLYSFSPYNIFCDAGAFYGEVEGMANKSIANFVLIALSYLAYVPIFLTIALYLHIRFAKKQKIIAGGERADEKVVYSLIVKDAKKTKMDGRIFLGRTKQSKGIPILENDEPRNFFFLGKAGAGKTVGLKNLIQDLLDNPKNDSFVIYERKGDDFISYLYREEQDYLFSPNDQRGISWNIFDDIKSDGDLEFLLSIIFPSDSSGGKDNHFDEQAKILMRAILLHVRDTTPNNKGMMDFFLANTDGLKLRGTLLNSQTVRKYGLTGEVEATLTIRDDALDGQASSVMATLNRYRSALKLRSMFFEEGNFSVKQFIKEASEGKAKRLFIYNQESQNGEYGLYLNILINFLMKEILSLKNDPNRRIWFILDEVQTLATAGMEKVGKGTIKKLTEMLSESRSKGACVVIATQTLEKLEDLVNKNNMMSLIQLLSAKIVFQYDSPTGQKLISDFIGKQKIEKERVSYGTSGEIGRTTTNTSTNEATQDILLASELNSLRILESFIKYSFYPLTKIRFEPVRTKVIAEEFIQRNVPFFEISEPKKKLLFDESRNDEWESLY